MVWLSYSLGSNNLNANPHSGEVVLLIYCCWRRIYLKPTWVHRRTVFLVYFCWVCGWWDCGYSFLPLTKPSSWPLEHQLKCVGEASHVLLTLLCVWLATRSAFWFLLALRGTSYHPESFPESCGAPKVTMVTLSLAPELSVMTSFLEFLVIVYCRPGVLHE